MQLYEMLIAPETCSFLKHRLKFWNLLAT